MVPCGLFDKIHGHSWSDHEPTLVILILSIILNSKWDHKLKLIFLSLSLQNILTIPSFWAKKQLYSNNRFYSWYIDQNNNLNKNKPPSRVINVLVVHETKAKQKIFVT